MYLQDFTCNRVFLKCHTDTFTDQDFYHYLRTLPTLVMKAFMKAPELNGNMQVVQVPAEGTKHFSFKLNAMKLQATFAVPKFNIHKHIVFFFYIQTGEAHVYNHNRDGCTLDQRGLYRPISCKDWDTDEVSNLEKQTTGHYTIVSWQGKKKD